AFSSDFRSCSRFSVRRQSAAHSRLLMCVPASQKPMQAATPGAPPPGALGADSLGLTLRAAPPPPGKVVTVPPDVAGVFTPTAEGVADVVPKVAPNGVVVADGADPPPVSVEVGLALPPLRKLELGAGDSGATAGTCGAGVPTADGGNAPGVIEGLAGAPNDGEGESPGEVESPPRSPPPRPVPRPPAPTPDEKPEVPPPRPWALAVCCTAPATRRPAAATRYGVRRLSIGYLRFRQCPLAQRVPVASGSPQRRWRQCGPARFLTTIDFWLRRRRERGATLGEAAAIASRWRRAPPCRSISRPCSGCSWGFWRCSPCLRAAGSACAVPRRSGPSRRRTAPASSP